MQLYVVNVIILEHLFFRRETIIAFSFVCILASKASVSQQPVKRLRIGDSVPNVSIGNLVNYQKASYKMSEFKDKLLIIDFWATWCMPCIASFPKLDSLQKEFEQELMILSVTSEEKKMVEEFLKKIYTFTQR